MTSTITAQLRQHPALAALSDSAWAQLEPQLRFLRFSIGQPLSEPELLPQQMLIVLQGEARLLSQASGRLTSLGKMGPGSVVGLASLLRVEDDAEVDIDAEDEEPAAAGRDEVQHVVEDVRHPVEVEQADDDEEDDEAGGRPEDGLVDAQAAALAAHDAAA